MGNDHFDNMVEHHQGNTGDSKNIYIKQVGTTPGVGVTFLEEHIFKIAELQNFKNEYFNYLLR